MGFNFKFNQNGQYKRRKNVFNFVLAELVHTLRVAFKLILWFRIRNDKILNNSILVDDKYNLSSI